MNDAILSIPDLSDDEQRTVSRLYADLQDKAVRNLLRSSYYDGKRAIRQVGTVVPPMYYRLGLVLGWTAKAVDALLQRCALVDMVWPDGDLASLGYQEFVDANQLHATFKGGQQNSALHGVSWAINTVGAEGEPKSLLHIKDALSGTGTWNSRTRRLEDFLSITSLDGEGNPDGLVLYLPNVAVVCDKDSSGWQVVRSGHRWGVPVEPVGYKPWSRDFGASRITRPMMGLQDRAVNALVRLEGHMDVYSFPELWFLGADQSMFKNEDGTMKADFRVMLGRNKALPDDDEAPVELARADIKQIQSASPQPHLAGLNVYAKLFARESGLSDSALAITDYSNPTSADSYIESREDMIAAAEDATRDWSLPLRRSVARGLAIQNGMSEVPAEWATIDARWRSPIYLSDSAEADAGAKRVGAVPWLAETEVGLELMGLSDQQIRRAMAEKRRATGRQLIESLRKPPTAEPVNDNASGPAQ